MTLEKKNKSICDGFISRNPSMDKYYLYNFSGADNYSIKESVGKTTYFLKSYEITEFVFLSDSKQWGFIGNILFSVIGLYADDFEYDENWYHIRIEAMK